MRMHRTLTRDQRGAVVVEFMIPFVPMLLMVFCFAELMRMASAQMALRHAANVGVRAAAVLVNSNPDDLGNRGLVDKAVQEALGRWNDPSFFSKVSVTANIASPTGTDPNALDTVRVQGRYHCAVPLAAKVLCGGGDKQMKPVDVSFPHQGAPYLK